MPFCSGPSIRSAQLQHEKDYEEPCFAFCNKLCIYKFIIRPAHILLEYIYNFKARLF